MRPVTQKNEAKIQFVTRHDTSTRGFYRAFLELLTVRYPQLAPEFHGRHESDCKNPFTGVDEELRWWAAPESVTGPEFPGVSGSPMKTFATIAPSAFKRKSKVKNYIEVRHPWKNKFGDPIFGLLSMWVAPDPKLDWWELFRDLTALFHPILGRMHIFSAPELQGLYSGSPQTSFWAGPGQPEVRGGLTNLAWANVFGDEFAGEVDEVELRQHGFTVVDIDGRKLFRVTELIFDVLDDFSAFSRHRAELKTLFRGDLFQIKEEPAQPTKNPADGSNGFKP